MDTANHQVTGRAIPARGTLGRPVLVRAFDKDLRTLELLGEAMTDADGRYSILYGPAAGQRAELGRVDLLMIAYQPPANTPQLEKAKAAEALRELGRAPVRFSAAPYAEIDIALGADDLPTEYERLSDTLPGLVQAQDVAIADIVENDLHQDASFLASETREKIEAVESFAIALRMSAQTRVDARIFHALLRENMFIGLDPARPASARLYVTLDTATADLVSDFAMFGREAIEAAVERAIAARIVPAETRGAIARAVAAAAKLLPAARAHHDAAGPQQLLAALGALVLPPQDDTALARLRNARLDDPGAVVLALQEFMAGRGKAEKARTALQIGRVVGYDPAAINKVRKAYKISGDADLARIARAAPEEVAAVVKPARGASRTSVAQAAAAVSRLRSELVARFPTAAIAGELERDRETPVEGARQVVAFLDANPGFDLLTANLAAVMREGKRAKKAARGGAQLESSLRQLQRVARLAPDYRQVSALLKRGLGSAHAIATRGRLGFRDEMIASGEMTAAEADRAYDRARYVRDAADHVAGEMRQLADAARVPFFGVGGTGAALGADLRQILADFPNLETLFGGGDACACKECRSIWGSAAYLVDILAFLQDRKTRKADGTSGDAWATLMERRSDLVELDLDCDNADIELPYIDIVCELLEEAVAPHAGVLVPGAMPPAGVIGAAFRAALGLAGVKVGATATISASRGPPAASFQVLRDSGGVYRLSQEGTDIRVRLTRQTLSSAAELRAAPFYVNADAYTALRNAQHAFVLPFDLDLVEARSYLDKLGTPRGALMRVFAPPSPGAPLNLAAEALSLSPAERDMIVGTLAPPPAQIWNTSPANPVTVLAKVDKALKATGLTFAEFEALVATRFVNPTGALKIKRPTPDPSKPETFAQCDPAQMQLDGLDGATLDRMHRFLRLHRHVDWTIAQLDLVIGAPRIGNGTLDANALIAIGALKAEQALLAKPIAELVLLYGALETTGPASLYRQWFQKPPVDPVLSLSAIRENEALAPADPARVSLAGASPSIAATLGLSVPTANGVIAAVLPTLGAVGTHLSVRGLAEVAGRVLLARILGLTPEAMAAYSAGLSIDPFASPERTIAFVQGVARFTAAGLTPADLAHFLAFDAPDSAQRGLADDAAAAILGSIAAQGAAALAPATVEIAAAPTAGEALGLVQLALKDGFAASSAIIGGIADLHAGSATAAGQPAAQFVAQDLAPLLAGDDLSAAAIAAAIEERRAALALAVAGSLPAATIARAQTALLIVIHGARAYAAARAAAASEALESQLKLPAEVGQALLRHAALKFPAAAGGGSIGSFLSAPALVAFDGTSFVAVDTSTSGYAHHRAALQLARHLGDLGAALRLTGDEIAWLLDRASSLGWIELDKLPYAAGQPASPMAGFAVLLDALAMARSREAAADPADSTRAISLFSIFDAAALATPVATDILAAYAIWSGHDPAALAALHARFGTAAADYRLPAAIARLEEGAAMLRASRLSLSGVDALIGSAGIAAGGVTLARDALREATAAADWNGVLRGVQDPIRIQKRDALVALLLARNPDLEGPNDLFDYFLIDTQMQSARNTSRLVSAHMTLQLFIDRCLMGLEPDATANVLLDEEWGQWSWMQNFRVWQANRQIYIYPENWIEPDLRDDKSEFFSAMEDSLQQNELNDRNAGEAAEAFLAKLDDTAFLEVVVCHYVVRERRMHVIARTRGGDPAVYYHRMFIKERSWTSWVKVELDIASDHLTMFTRDGRLFMAWLVMSEEADADSPPHFPGSTPPATQSPEMPRKRWNIQIAVSEYDGKKWLTPRLSRDPLRTGDYRALPSRDHFRLWALAFTSPMDLTAGTLTEITDRAVSPDTQSIMVSYVEDGVWPDGYGGTGFSRTLGLFSLVGCKGYPEPYSGGGDGLSSFLPQFLDSEMSKMRFRELGQDAVNDLTIATPLSFGAFTQILAETPDELFKPSTRFRIAYPLQTSPLDVILYLYFIALTSGPRSHSVGRQLPIPLGTLMPFFFEDGKRGYVVTPTFFNPVDEADPRRETFSDVMDILDECLDRALYYVPKLQAAGTDPAKLSEIAREFGEDEKVAKIIKEIVAYWGLIPGYRFDNFFHPLICYLRSQFQKGGFRKLLSRETQAHGTGFDFAKTYKPSVLVASPLPRETIDFDRSSAYADCNWDIFFQLPYLVAVMFKRRQKFEEAWHWFHYVFDPIGAHDGPIPQRYWVTRAFSDQTPADMAKQRIEAILYGLAADPLSPANQQTRDAIEDWRARPFSPHTIARSRPLAYQRAIVFAYVDNLIEWGDSLFRQYTGESINRATELYVLADKILGRRPEIVESANAAGAASFSELRADLDAFGNAMIELENFIPPVSGSEGSAPTMGASLRSPYFCIPPNSRAFDYWDRVADRLTKIRNSRNIDGLEIPVALYAPAIDPGALVRAAAAGLDIGSVIAGFSAPLPIYRFEVLVQKSVDLAQEARAVSAALLAAMEKRDGEAVARLRAENEIRLLKAILDVRSMQWAEAEQQISALKKQIETVQAREAYYLSRSYMNTGETVAMVLNAAALIPNIGATALHAAAAIISLAPTMNIGISGFGGTPAVQVSWGSQNVLGALTSGAAALSGVGGLLQQGATLASTVAGYDRRKEEWEFQGKVAGHEIAALNAQVTAAEIRRDLARREIENQKMQIADAQSLKKYQDTKFTNKELYDWTVGRLMGPVSMSYNLAFGMALKAQRCLNYQLGTDQSFIVAGHWDSVRKGLTAADLLIQDLKRMEVAYLDQNRRDHESSITVSLAQIDPEALEILKRTGSCFFNIPEAVLDLETPGQLMRRLKTLSVTVPCVAGPYATVALRLTQVAHKYRATTRFDPAATDDIGRYQEAANNGDDRFVYGAGAIQSIITSQAQNDSGLFEVNLHDERYLPFEGTGAISTWKIDILSSMPSFEMASISDVALQLKLTSRDGGDAFRAVVNGALTQLLIAMALDGTRTGLWHTIDLSRDHGVEWNQIVSTGTGKIRLVADSFPPFTRGRTITPIAMRVFAKTTKTQAGLTLSVGGAVALSPLGTGMPPVLQGTAPTPTLDTDIPITSNHPEVLHDLLLLVNYKLS